MLAAVIVLAPYLSPANAAAGCERGPNTSIWTTIPGPNFESGDRIIDDHAVDPADADRIYASNGSSIYLTTDSCNWKKAYELQPLGGGPLGGATSARIKEVVAPKPGLVVLMIEESAGPVSRPRVVTSAAGGAPGTWEEGGIGLPPTGQPQFLSPFPTQGSVLFLGVDTGGGTSDLLYVSLDAGRTFTLRSDLSQTKADAGIDGLKVDPIDPDSLWAYGSGGLYHSTDGGASFKLIDDFTDTDAGPVDVFHAPGSPAAILAFTPAEGGSLRSTDGGKTFLAGSAPGATDSVDSGLSASQLLATANGNTYVQDPNTGGWFDLDAPNSGTRGVLFHQGGGELTATVHTASTIERLAAPDGNITPPPKPDEGTGIDVGFTPTSDRVEEPATLSPKRKTVFVRPGREKTVDYRLDLPQRYVPLDVYFLVDTSSSMTRTLKGLAMGIADIADELERSKIDVQFGIAEYRAYPDVFPPREEEPNFVYRQLVDIGPIGEPLAQAIEGLEADAGGVYDAQLGALLQAATGSGVDVAPYGTPPGVPDGGDVPPGQQARFREVALGKRVIIMPTDEPFGDDDSGEGNNSFVPRDPPRIPELDEVVPALTAKGIDVVGLSIGPQALDDLTDVARGTGTFAPEEGVDCDGDGDFDIPGSAPLVCKLPATESEEALNLVEPVVSLLKAVAQRVPVSLQVTEGLKVVTEVEPEVYPEVILQTANVLKYEVTYTCSKKQEGKSFPVELQIRTGDELDLKSEALVKCKNLPEEEKKREKPPAVLPITPLVPPLVALVVPPPPPPPPPVTEVSSASQINAQSQAQAQGAGAHQEQEEPQLAYVQAYDETKTQGELAMSSYRGRRGQLPFEAVLGAGVVVIGLMSATGVAMRRRLKLQTIRRR